MKPSCPGWQALSQYICVTFGMQCCSSMITWNACFKFSILQVAELASLAQLLPLCSPTCVIRRRTALCQSCCSPIASASAAARLLHRSASTAAPRLRPLQLLVATCVCFSCYSPHCIRFNCSTIASASAVAPRLCLLQLLLRLHLQLPDCVRFDCCSPNCIRQLF